MKAVVLAVFAVLLVAVSCRPDKLDLKHLKAEAERKRACMQDCAKVKFDPVCAGKQGEKPKSFGSECVMNNHNCEHKENTKLPTELTWVRRKPTLSHPSQDLWKDILGVIQDWEAFTQECQRVS